MTFRELQTRVMAEYALMKSQTVITPVPTPSTDNSSSTVPIILLGAILILGFFLYKEEII